MRIKKILFTIALLSSTVAIASETFTGQPAMDIYNTLTGPNAGPNVKSDPNEMGGGQVTGQQIVCQFSRDVNATDGGIGNQANYSCTIRFGLNGEILHRNESKIFRNDCALEL